MAAPEEVELNDEDGEPSDAEYQRLWATELSAAHEEVKPWHRRAEKIIKRFRDDRADGESSTETRLNIFTSNVQTMRAMLYGNTPQVDVGRKFADSLDDAARVGGEMMERALNSDIERDNNTYAVAIAHALDDHLLVGAGIVRNRYVCETETRTTPAITHPVTGEELAPEVSQEVKTSEDVETDYVYWEDFRWSPARTWSEVRWVAFRAAMTRKALRERFGAVAERVPMNTKKRGDDVSAQKHDPRSRADVWEIWSKEHKKVFWYVEGMDVVLDHKDDPLQLENFWPMPQPLFSNLTTSSLVPVPDFYLSQDQYNEIDVLSTRIALLQKALKVAGVYDGASPSIQRLVQEENENKLIPVENWAMFAEKGGIKGCIDWFPLEMVVAALDKLCEQRSATIALSYQVSGMSDVMRGQAVAQTTATEQAIKAKFASVRTQSAQDEFARFASEAQAIKAEIISKHYDPETIVKLSNIEQTPDAPLAAQAIALIKSQFFLYRIRVRPEAVSLTDYAALKNERAEFITTLSQFLQAAAPAAMQMPGSMPYLLQMLQWAMAGFKGASEVEGILDQAIAQAQQAAQQAAMAPPQGPPPDPRLQQLQMKGQIDMAHTKAELQADMIRTQAEVKADRAKQATKFAFQSAAQAQKAAHAGNGNSPLAVMDRLIPGPGGQQ